QAGGAGRREQGGGIAAGSVSLSSTPVALTAQGLPVASALRFRTGGVSMRMGILAALALLVTACGQGSSSDVGSQQDALEPSTRHEPPMKGIHWARGQAPASRPPASPNLVYHGGPVMESGAYVEPIFWGTSWGSSAFVGDKITGMQLFYGTIGGSHYAATNSEYTDASGADVGTTVRLGPTHVDLSAAPAHGIKTSEILAEACAR